VLLEVSVRFFVHQIYTGPKILRISKFRKARKSISQTHGSYCSESERSGGYSNAISFKNRNILDTDDIKTGWHRRTHLPDLNSKDGIRTIRKDVSSKKLIFNAVPAPELKEITAWKDMLVNWARQNRKAINRIAGEEVITGAKERILFERIKDIFGLWKDIQARAESYGSSNSIFLIK
jgi:hypothetical protein